MNRRVVITGLGTINPLAHRASELWNRLCEGHSGVGEITQFDASAFKVRFAGEVRDFTPDNWMDGKLAKRLDRFSQLRWRRPSTQSRTAGWISTASNRIGAESSWAAAQEG